MIKKAILAILIALPMSVFAQKFGVVDVESIISAMPEYATVQKQIADASQKYQDEFDKLNEEMNKKVTEYQTLDQDATTPQSIKERRIQEIQELDNKIQQFRNTASQDIARQQQQLMAPVEQKFQEAITSVGQEGGYTFIFQKGVALYDGAGVVDVTSAVKAKLGVN
ncbi:MAG: OmpH family outer membrane protein [Bacteroidales bacterium]|nr:OmpH family outer membrane protein [Bacteroidales bacterium]